MRLSRLTNKIIIENTYIIKVWDKSNELEKLSDKEILKHKHAHETETTANSPIKALSNAKFTLCSQLLKLPKETIRKNNHLLNQFNDRFIFRIYQKQESPQSQIPSLPPPPPPKQLDLFSNIKNKFHGT